MTEEYYSDEDIASLLGISLSRLRGKIYQGDPLPARIQVPGSRTRLWAKRDVHNWLDQFKMQDELDDTKTARKKLKH